jgi:hypothetical protein
MNINNLAKHYDTLTAWERLPLIVAAQQRGDWQEVRRLAASAPCHEWRVPDYCGLAEGLPLLTLLHWTRRLATALHLVAVAGIALRDGLGEGKKEKQDQREEEATDALRLLAYRLSAQTDGWKQFCAELQMDPEARLRFLPGYDEVQSYEQAFRGFAFTHAEALAYLRQTQNTDGPAGNTDGADGLTTAKDVAQELRSVLEWFKAKWDGRSDPPDALQGLRNAWEELNATASRSEGPAVAG